MSKTFAKTLIKEKINDLKQDTDKIVDYHILRDSNDLFSGYFFNVLVVTKHHNVVRYSSFISDDYEFDDIKIVCF